MKTEILSILDKVGAKAFGAVIKNKIDLWQWVMDNSIQLADSASTTERIFVAINGYQTLCPNGNDFKFKSFTEGYKFCGRANVCLCAKQAVSNSVKRSKELVTPRDQQATNQKREHTTLTLYGVKNIGTSDIAKEARQEALADPQRMLEAKTKYQSTMMERYGVDNGLKLPAVKALPNPMKDPEIVKKVKETKSSTMHPRQLLSHGYDKVVERLASIDIKVLTPFDDYLGSGVRGSLELGCQTCNHTWSQRYDHANYPKCKICHPTSVTFKSQEELAVLDHIKSIYNGKIISGDRSIINPFEVDILLPELNLAIEYCGLYWHSELSSGKKYNYHKSKMDLLTNKGYRLITIFSDEWNQSRELVKNKIRNIMGLDLISIHGRKCIVEQIDYHSAVRFLNDNHIQGSPKKLKVNIGIKYNDELIGVMSFTENGLNWELVRFATTNRIIGGASKMLKYFINKYKPTTITSFADLRWSNGNLYHALGFKEVHRVPPMQTYVEDYSIRHHKLAMNKQKFSHLISVDQKTEWEVLQELGYDRIWDCGKIKFELTV